MGFRGVAILLILLACFAAVPPPARAQLPPPSEQLTLTAKSAATWIEGNANLLVLHGPIRIELDRAVLTADDAVVWLTPASQENQDVENAEIALLGHAKLEQPGVTRSGDRLYVTDQVRGGKIRIVADERAARDESKSELYLRGLTLRQAEQPVPSTGPVGPATTQSSSAIRRPARPQTRPATTKPADLPLFFEAKDIESVHDDEGNAVFVLTGGVRMFQHRPNNDLIELSADDAVLFTPLKSLKELGQSGGRKQGQALITSAYLEGDVRIDYSGQRKGMPEQRLTANRVYYEFATDRAVLTDAVVHTVNPQTQQPILMRARLVHQLANAEYISDNVRLTNSEFAVPSYSLASDRMYMRSEPTGDPRIGDRIIYDATNVSLQAFNLPFFFWPHLAGEMTEHGMALRAIGGGQDSIFGTFAESAWGLFETFGKIPPRDLDVNYRVDYFSDRGPAFGLNANYGGGFITDTTRQAWDFDGRIESYFVDDKGEDQLGEARFPTRVDEPQTLRGQVLFEHQHYFPDGWQAQARLGWVSDATFMEQWFRNEFQDNTPRNFMGYLKHQTDSEAFTFGATFQPNKVVTTSEYQQEQFEIDRLPEVGYYREGESILNDHLTLFSENDVAGLHFAQSKTSLANQGFDIPIGVTPGLPAEGYTGIVGGIVWRGDFRQQVDAPFTVGPFRVDPYVMGRYTEYSNSPSANQQSRFLVGAGTRVTTELWKVDPTAESDVLDIHQLRHVIEPEVNLFTSAMNVQQGQVFVYDPQVDAVNDLSLASFALHQRWETKRGGPGEWRSVDMFSLNVEVDYFANKPRNKFLNPNDFRGLFFSAYPEESVPRDAVNADASWRLSDNTVLLGDMSFNLDHGSLQTLALGILVRRENRLAYFIGNRYVGDLNSNITTIHLDYELAAKYLVSLDQDFDFTQGKNVYSSASIIRRFDTFFVSLRYYYDVTTQQNGVAFNIYPQGLGYGLDTSSFNTFHK